VGPISREYVALSPSQLIGGQRGRSSSPGGGFLSRGAGAPIDGPFIDFVPGGIGFLHAPEGAPPPEGDGGGAPGGAGDGQGGGRPPCDWKGHRAFAEKFWNDVCLKLPCDQGGALAWGPCGPIMCENPNRNKWITVKVCVRQAQVPGGAIWAAGGLFHMWIVLDDGDEWGLGPQNRNVPGYDSSPNPYEPYYSTSVNRHTGESTASGAECTSISVKECCIREEIKPGATGVSCVNENCNAWTYRIVAKCGGDTERIDVLRRGAQGGPSTNPVNTGSALLRWLGVKW